MIDDEPQGLSLKMYRNNLHRNKSARTNATKTKSRNLKHAT